MSNNNKSMQSTVETVDLDLNEIFDGAVTAEGVTVPEENSDKPKNNIFSKISPDADMSFADPTGETTDLAEEVEKTDEVKSQETDNKLDRKEAKDILDTFAEEDNEEVSDEIEEKINKGSGASQIFKTLIEKDKLVGFDDDRSLDEYSVKDWEELIEANLEEKARQIRNETPKQFFQSLPEELQIAARYVAEGGQDMKGLFQTLAQTEETRSLNVKSERDQEKIILDYLTATGYGTSEEISEEIEMWKDLGKLEQQASKFKPKLDKMQEKVVAQKLEQQQLKRKQQEQASQTYMQNVYDTLKEGTVNEVKMGRKTQAMLYNGLVEPNYPSVSGKNTNLLGHLLEKYQFVEPNYPLIAEALWLLADPKGYKSKIMDKGAHTAVEKTVRKLKTEQANSGGSSLGVQQRDEEKTSSKRKISRPNNIFKRT
tara:strand:- start:332 stop:1612 length:1281 start_codon:yes stop_codon:yes gene_type:complete